MGVNNTPASDRIHTGFFGRRNAGKSGILNTVTGQDLAVVLDAKGTTVGSIYKAMELLFLGPVMMIDTPGIDSEDQLGSPGVRKSYRILNKTDVAVLVMDVYHGPAPEDYIPLKKIGGKQTPCVAVCNKADVAGAAGGGPEGIPESVPVLSVSAHIGRGITALKECLANLGKTQEISRKIVGDLPSPSDLTVLVMPIDRAAPKGCLILPQQQTIRDILETDAVSVVVRENGLRDTLVSLGKKPRMVITDSQAFAKVNVDTSEDIPLTSFSILSARYKGNPEPMVWGVRTLDRTGEEDRALICEGCIHHWQCENIRTVKLPERIREYIETEPKFVLTSGAEFPDDLAGSRLVIHCGGCMLNERETKYRMRCAHGQGTSIASYSITIAYVRGVLRRSVEPFPEIAALFCGSREGWGKRARASEREAGS